MRIVYVTVLILIGFATGEDVANEKTDGNLRRDKKDIGKIQALLGLKSKPFYGSYQDYRPPVYAPQCDCWRPTSRPYASDDSVVVYPPQPAPRPIVLPAQPALIAPARIQPAQPALIQPAQPAIYAPARIQPALPAFYAPARIQPAQPAFSFNAHSAIPAAPALIASDVPQPCPPGYNYDKPTVSFNS